MGYYKNKMIEEEGRGFSDPGEIYVCDNCFGDYAIKEFIRDNVAFEICEYCKRTDKNHIDSPLELFL